jgi:hypothetical protein
MEAALERSVRNRTSKIANLMSPKFGSYLFRNLKGQTTETNAPAGALGTFGAFEEQPISLRREDIRADDPKAPPLDWSKIEGGQIAVQLKDTQGIMEGCVTIKASTLHRMHPHLLRQPLEGDYLFAVSLKTVVLQLQAHLQSKFAESPKAGGPDYDTPIAQVAREDEGFFRLENVDKQPPAAAEKPLAKPASNEPFLTPADHPSFPPIREKTREAQSEIPPLEITLQPAAQQSESAQETRFKTGLFDQLPKVGLEPLRNKGPEIVSGRAATQESEKDSETLGQVDRHGPARHYAEKPPRRCGLERLQEIFMTEDLLDAREVAALITRFPKIDGALILSGSGTVIGGNLPKEFQADAASLAPSVLRTVQEFGLRLKSRKPFAVTIFFDLPLSLCSVGDVCILVAHQGRGLLPGMRERICEIAKALDLLYGQGDSVV